MPTQSFSVDLGLSAFPELDQKQYPQIWAELMRMRNAISLMMQAIEAPGTVPTGGNTGQVLAKIAATDFAMTWQDQSIGPDTVGGSATFVVGAGVAVNAASTFDGYTLPQVVRALRNLGVLL